MKSKKFFLGVICGTLILLFILALPTIIVDPYFHYRAPQRTYRLHNQRYQNNGIVRHFEYDALITGSSMTENFQTTQMDRLFSTKSIKIPYSGAYFMEIDQSVNAAIDANSNLKMVIRSLDLNMLNMEKDSVRYDNYPTFLYDDNWINDVNYFFNKQVLLDDTKEFIQLEKRNAKRTSFDEYSSWDVDVTLSEVLKETEYPGENRIETSKSFTEKESIMVHENIQQNIVETALENPQITFYLFFPPYSCMYYDSLIREGEWDYHIATQQCVIEELLECENIKLFSFCDWYEVTCDLTRYKDIAHYDADVNSGILEKMKAGEGLLTEDNYKEYLSEIKEYYLSLDTRKYYQ